MALLFGPLCAAAVCLGAGCSLDAYGTSAAGGMGEGHPDAAADLADMKDVRASESREGGSSAAPGAVNEGGGSGIEAGGAIEAGGRKSATGSDGSAEAATGTDGSASASGAAGGAAPSGDTGNPTGTCDPSGNSNPHCDRQAIPDPAGSQHSKR